MNPIYFNPFPVLLTERFILRALTDADIQPLFELKSSAIVAKYTGIPLDKSLEDTKTFIKKIKTNIAQNKSVYWVIEDKKTHTFLGTICLWNISLEEESADVGYELLPAFWKQKIMTEVLTVVMDYAFNVIRFKQLYAVTNPHNTASIRLLERLDFVRNDDLNDFDLSESGEKIPLVFYIATKKDRS
ncbi:MULTISPECIES: GNAT family N-acetyltransferase [unclassified Listeria]|uniref:GNAT family N-acetyltransferase n=1 Tax=unclassified Listeria TaxID=2642072 RepID=UPI000B593E11|nr:MULTISPECIES: GNAT family N-acetyltransferase [unclassified Listeria]